jgi:hypothetical protein
MNQLPSRSMTAVNSFFRRRFDDRVRMLDVYP